MKVLAVVLVLLVTMVTAYAAEVDGSWTGSVDSPQGDGVCLSGSY